MAVRKILVAALVLIGPSVIWPCGPARAEERLKVTSPAFKDGAMIPQRHAYDFENASPELAWSGAPAGTKSFAVVCDDPDAPRGAWTHWVIFNIPPVETGLPEGMPKDGDLSGGAVQLVNDFKGIGYDGPAPPYGIHRYVFTVYALDAVLGLGPGAKKQELFRAMAGHIVGQGHVTGRFRKTSGAMMD